MGVAAQDAGLFRRDVVAAVGLGSHGLEWVEPAALATSLIGRGEALTLWRHPAITRHEIAHHSQEDASRYAEWVDYLDSMARTFRVVLDHPAPPLHDLTRRERIRLLRPLVQAARLGKRNVVELLRVLPLPARDLLDDWFTGEALKGMLGTTALLGTSHGPSAMGAPSACSTTPPAARPAATAHRRS